MSTPIPSLGNKTPEQLKVTELREELKKRGIYAKGLKKDLVERLEEVLREELNAEELKASSGHEEKSSEAEEESSPLAEQIVEAAALVSPAKVVEEAEAVVEPEIVPPTADGVSVGISKSAEGELSTKHVELLSTKLPVVVPELVSEVAPVSPIEPTVVDVPTEETVDLEVSQLSESEPEVPGNDPVETDDRVIEVNLQDAANTFESETKTVHEDAADGTDLEAEPNELPESTGEVEADSDKLLETGAEIMVQDAEGVEPVVVTSAREDVLIDVQAEISEVEAEPAVTTGPGSTGVNVDVQMVEGRAEEEDGVTGDAAVVTVKTTVTETVSVVTETTVVTVDESACNVMEAHVDHSSGPLAERISDAVIPSIKLEGKEVVNEQLTDKDDEGMDVDEYGKVKESKPMDVDSDILPGSKRKEGGSTDDARLQEPAKRQRRWNTEKNVGGNSDVKSPSNVLTTDTVKEIVPMEVRETVQAPVVGSPSTTVGTTPKTSASTSFDKPAPSRPPLTRTDASVNGEVDKKRHVPPSSKSPSTSLKIDRFVRPFTIKAVKKLLEETGTVKDMWMDQIKTHCYVTYSSVEEATATRNALYNLQWPVTGGKLLVAEFVEPEEVKLRVDGLADNPAATPVTTPRGSANNAAPMVSSAGLVPPLAPTASSALPPPPPPPLPPPPRERPALPPKKELEPPIPTLDDLFKKTRTKPQIYYLPMTEEQVVVKLRNKPPVNKSSVKA